MWSQLALVTDAELGAIEPQAIANDRPWGRDTWAQAIAEAMKDLRVWIDLAYPDIPIASDRLIDRWSFAYVWQWLASQTYGQDYGARARDDNEHDLDFGGVLFAGGNTLLAGQRFQYDGVFFKLSTANTLAAGLTVEYYGAAGWTTASFDDATAVNGVTLARSGRVRLSVVPADWEPVRLNQGDEFYWLRLGVNSAIDVATKGTQLVAVRPADGLKRVAAFLTLAYIKRGLADASGDPDYWQKSAADYQTKAEDLFDRLKTVGLPLDVLRQQVIVAESRERNFAGPVRLGRA